MIIAKEYVLHYPREVDLDNHRRMHLGRSSAMGSGMADSSDARDSGGYRCLDHHFFLGNRSRLQGLAGGQKKERKAYSLDSVSSTQN